MSKQTDPGSASAPATGYATDAFAVLVCGSQPYLWGEHRDDEDEDGTPGYVPALFGSELAASGIASTFVDGTEAKVVKVRISVESHNNEAELRAQQNNESKGN